MIEKGNLMTCRDLTCRDCIYIEACYALNKEIRQHPRDFLETNLCSKQCKTFKARADFLDTDKVISIVQKLATVSEPSPTFHKVFSKVEKFIAEKCTISSATDEDLKSE
jgi:hypothetical protein